MTLIIELGSAILTVMGIGALVAAVFDGIQTHLDRPRAPHVPRAIAKFGKVD